jgi:glycosyltransferase involved in cell wall biosynthesis
MVPVGDADALAAALVAAVRDDGLRARIVAGGRDTAARFTWQAAAAAHEEVYGRLRVAA